LKLLSDFDGVWTNPAEEADAVRRYFVREAIRLAGVDEERGEREFADLRATVMASPQEYGWCVEGRLTAYVDEDPFCLPNTIGAFLGRSEDPQHRLYREAILAAGHASTEAFANHCFFEATSAFRKERPPALVPRACEVLETLMEAGIELVIVSNSPPEKIEGWFEDVGAHLDHDHFRICGQAGKHELGDDTTVFDVGERSVRIDRPRYRCVLEEEAPDLVVGDVFSLDLALPCWLRREGLGGAPRMTILHRQPHTPSWVMGLAKSGPVDRVIDGIAELVPIVRGHG
jgi:FMN phosphatase YigB (HAD superfamily)